MDALFPILLAVAFAYWQLGSLTKVFYAFIMMIGAAFLISAPILFIAWLFGAL